MRGALQFVRVGVFGDFHVVNEGVPFFPVADVEDGVVDDLWRCGDGCGGVEGEEPAAGDVVGGSRSGEVGVVEVFA